MTSEVWHGFLRPRPNVWRQWRAQRVHCTPGLGRSAWKEDREFVKRQGYPQGTRPAGCAFEKTLGEKVP